MRLRSLLPITVVFLAGALTGCGDDSTVSATAGDPATRSSATAPSPGSGDPSDLPQPTPPPNASDPANPTDPGSPTTPGTEGEGEVTPPGTVLSYGEPAVVDVFTEKGDTGFIEYTVTGVTTGKGSSLGPTTLISVDVRAITDLTGALALGSFDWKATGDNGEDSVFALEENCDDTLPVTAEGETGTMCIAVSMPEGSSSVAQVQYNGFGFTSDPIVWEP